MRVRSQIACACDPDEIRSAPYVEWPLREIVSTVSPGRASLTCMWLDEQGRNLCKYEGERMDRQRWGA